jgi:hypothetical protein
MKVIDAFQLLSGTEVDDGWTPLHRLDRAIGSDAGGILQADGEASATKRTTPSSVSLGRRYGPWNLSVMVQCSRWVHFEMDLGNGEHREAFWRGEVPAGVRLI